MRECRTPGTVRGCRVTGIPTATAEGAHEKTRTTQDEEELATL